MNLNVYLFDRDIINIYVYITIIYTHIYKIEIKAFNNYFDIMHIIFDILMPFFIGKGGCLPVRQKYTCLESVYVLYFPEKYFFIFKLNKI